MKKISVHQFKTHFSKYLLLVQKGETIVVCNRNVPVAEIRSFVGKRTNPRPIGLAKNQFTIPKTFFEPLPDDFFSHFSEKDC